MENLITGMVLVSLVLWLFLGKLRAALLVALNLPLALLFAFFGMVSTGTQANLISLGAVDFGIVVDSSVIMMESIFPQLCPARRFGFSTASPPRPARSGRRCSPPRSLSRWPSCRSSTLTGVAGRDHGADGAHLCLCHRGRDSALAHFSRRRCHRASCPCPTSQDEEEKNTRFMRLVHRLYAPLFSFALQRPRWAVLLGAAPVVVALAAAGILGREFMPKLEEGNFLDPRDLANIDLPREVGPLRRSHSRHRARLPR